MVHEQCGRAVETADSAVADEFDLVGRAVNQVVAKPIAPRPKMAPRYGLRISSIVAVVSSPSRSPEYSTSPQSSRSCEVDVIAPAARVGSLLVVGLSDVSSRPSGPVGRSSMPVGRS
jgi:hypothetical protein